MPVPSFTVLYLTENEKTTRKNRICKDFLKLGAIFNIGSFRKTGMGTNNYILFFFIFIILYYAKLEGSYSA